MTDQNQEHLKPDPEIQKRFNIMMVVLLAAAGVLFYWAEPALYETGMPPVLGDIYNVNAPANIKFSITPRIAERLAFKSDFFMALFLGLMVVSLFLPLWTNKSYVIKRHMADYSVKCPAEFYTPYLTFAAFLLFLVWSLGHAFFNYAENDSAGFIDSILVKAAPFFAALIAAMLAALFKGLLVFRVVVAELGTPEPDIENVPGRYVYPWGLRKALFKQVLWRSNNRFDRQILLENPGWIPWAIGGGLILLALYSLVSGESSAGDAFVALIWIVVGLLILPASRRMVFVATGQSLSLPTRLGVVVLLLLIASAYPG